MHSAGLYSQPGTTSSSHASSGPTATTTAEYASIWR